MSPRQNAATLGLVLHINSSLALWACTQNSDCSLQTGSICLNGNCQCPTGQQSVLGGSLCADVAPYLTSSCYEDHQCSRIFGPIECRNANNTDAGSCFCQPGHHYFVGRCWPSRDFGESCTRDEECLGVLRDPYNMRCDGTCICADGYYSRQRGECRRIGAAVGEGCVINEDCQFEGGACSIGDFKCYNSTEQDLNLLQGVAVQQTRELYCDANNDCPEPFECTIFAGRCICPVGYYTVDNGNKCVNVFPFVGSRCFTDDDCNFEGGACNKTSFRCYNINDGENGSLISINIGINPKIQEVASRQSGQVCDGLNTCPQPFECTIFGVCVCPVGYYSSADGTACLAELGSPSTAEQCIGVFTEIKNGVCTCQANFYYEENMRDCVKATTRITDSCVSDANCHTFGAAAICGSPQLPWGLRNCECIPELAVWDSNRNMCRLFAGIGKTCQVDSDCLAGELEIQCVADESGQGYCTCPEGLLAVDGLCLTTGLELGDACQADQECTETANTVCSSGRCSCGNGYREEDGFCAPTIGGACVANSDCVIENTICQSDSGISTCQCESQFVTYDDECWPVVDGFGSTCNVTAQCVEAMGEASACTNGQCLCAPAYHYRDEICWPQIGLFETCNRHSECYLGDNSDRVVCRNSLCQCDFDYPYSEELHTCLSGSSTVATISGILLTMSILLNSLI